METSQRGTVPPALHRAIVCVDVEGFSGRINPDQVAVRAALYDALRQAFAQSGIPFDGDDCYREDRGDGALILISPKVPKNLLAAALPRALATVLHEHNQAAAPETRMRLRIVLHAGEVHHDDHGVAATAINHSFRLLDAGPLKRALRGSPGTLALIASHWFFEEVIRQDRAAAATYRQVEVSVKETQATAWICLPDDPGWPEEDVTRSSPGAPGVVRGDVNVYNAVAPAPAAMHTLPADIASFTGRRAQLEQIAGVLPGQAAGAGVVEVSAIDGMAGVGKTAFAVHAAHRLAPQFPNGQIFLRLHGHTPGQRPLEPADALAELLLAIGIAPQHIPAGLQAREGLWRDRMAGKKMLLLLDDATGSDQVRPLLPGGGETLVLVTSRRRLTALQDAVPVALDILQPGEAAQLLVRLTGRPGLQPSDGGVVEVVALCGYLPLAIGVMAGQLKHHPAWTAASLAAELAAAKDRLAWMRAENDSVTAAFELSYRDLAAGQQRFFRRLGLQPGSDIDAYAAAALGEVDLLTARSLLEELYAWHLIDEPTRGRYRFHDLIRQHARTLASAEPADQDAAMNRLLDYYVASAQTADRHLALGNPAQMPAVTGLPPSDVPPLPTRQAAAAWMDTERLNLHAAVDYAAHHDRPSHAIAIPAAMHGFLHTQGHWGQALALYHIALNAAHHTNDRLAAASTLSHLGRVQRMMGDFRAATTSLSRAVEVSRDIADQYGEADALDELGILQWLTGDFRAATTSLSRAVEVSRDIADQYSEAAALGDLGAVQRLTGDFRAATTSLTRALQLARDIGDQYGEANAFYMLGPVQYLTGDYEAATTSLTRALQLYRDLGNRYGEASVLTYLGRVQQAAGDYRAAATSLSRALQLSRDLGHRHCEAESLNGMGELSLACSRPAEACARHELALAIARDLGVPAEEARALEGIGLSQMRDGRPGKGAALLRQALAIYQRHGFPDAQRVETTLNDHVL